MNMRIIRNFFRRMFVYLCPDRFIAAKTMHRKISTGAFAVVYFVFYLSHPAFSQDIAIENIGYNKYTDHSTVHKLKKEDPAAKELSSLFFAFDYSSNTATFGNFNQFVKQPSYAPSVTFFSAYHFDLGLTGNIIANSDDSLDMATYELDMNAGYSLSFLDEKLVIYPAYSHFFYSENSGFLKSAFSNSFQLSAYYTGTWFSSGIAANYLTGDYKTFFGTIYAGPLLDKENLLFRNSLFSFTPEVDLNFGDYEYLNTYYFSEYPSLLISELKRKDFKELVILRVINPDMSQQEIIDYFAKKYAEDNFKLTSVGLLFPVNYTIGKFSYNVGVMIYFPVNMPDYLDSSTQVYFNAGISYMIDF